MHATVSSWGHSFSFNLNYLHFTVSTTTVYRAVTERETTIMDHEEEEPNPKIGTLSEDNKVDKVQGVKISILHSTIVG